MDRRKTAKHSRDPLPVGTVRIRRDRRVRVRMVKVRADGPPAGRWVDLARWWWERNRGPVPPGKRVCHLDGNCLNDNPTNYGLLTAGEVIKLYHRLRPEMSRENRIACGRATTEHNKLRGRLRRLASFLPTRWYPVDHEQRQIHNRPRRERWQVLHDFGVACGPNSWRRWFPAAVGYPDLIAGDASMLAALGSDPLRANEILAAANLLRSRYGLPRLETSGYYSGVTRLRQLGLLVSTGLAEAIRREVCPVVPVKGITLSRDESYRSYRKLPPWAEVG
jgi:hypothetical protein